MLPINSSTTGEALNKNENWGIPIALAFAFAIIVGQGSALAAYFLTESSYLWTAVAGVGGCTISGVMTYIVLRCMHGVANDAPTTPLKSREEAKNEQAPLTLVDMPSDVFLHISDLLPTCHLVKLAQVNRHAHVQVKRAQLRRAQEYGYQGADPDEAKNYLMNLFQTVCILAKDQVIPKDYVTRQEKWLFWSVDAETTYRNMKCLNAKQTAYLKAHFDGMLCKYANKGQIETVWGLLKLGANPDKLNDLNRQNRLGFTVLHDAVFDTVYYGRPLERVRTLLKLAANPNILDNFGRTPLMLASVSRLVLAGPRKDLISLLLEFGADPNIADNDGAIFLIENIHYPNIIELLCQKGADVNLQNVFGDTALHYAAWNRNIETVTTLLRFGADPSIVSNGGYTPSMVTRSPLIKKLLNAAHPNIITHPPSELEKFLDSFNET